MSLTGADTREAYTHQIESIIESFAGDYGYIEYSDTIKLAGAIGEIDRKAQEEMKKGNYRRAFYMAAAILDGMKQIMYRIDDSAGYIGGTICCALELLTELAAGDPDESIRRELVDYVISVVESKTLRGFDYEEECIEIAFLLMKTEEEKENIHKLLRIYWLTPLSQTGKKLPWKDMKQSL
ncbi:MAG: hypothetical protein LUE93_09640 [Bacteroides sp.]|nr:hypothetical protein [Bacteroides sp.]